MVSGPQEIAAESLRLRIYGFGVEGFGVWASSNDHVRERERDGGCLQGPLLRGCKV